MIMMIMIVLIAVSYGWIRSLTSHCFKLIFYITFLFMLTQLVLYICTMKGALQIK